MMMTLSSVIFALLTFGQSGTSPTNISDVPAASIPSAPTTFPQISAELNEKYDEKYKPLGFPFDERWLYSSRRLDLIADAVLSFLDGYDPQSDPDGTDPKRALIVNAVRTEIEKARHTNNNSKIVNNYNIIRTDSIGTNQVRLAAAFYVAERLKLVEPMDVFLEYAWVKVARNATLLDMASNIGSLTEIKYTGEKEVMMFPAAAAILHARENSFQGLCQIIGDASQPEHQRLKAAVFLKSLNVSADSVMMVDLLKNCEEEMALAISIIVAYRSPMGGGYTWLHAPTSIKRMQLELANEIRYTRMMEQKLQKN